VSVRAEPRFTRDVDVAVAVPDDNAAEDLVHSLLSKYRIDASIEQDAIGRLSTVRLVPTAVRTGEEVIVDVLFASSGSNQRSLRMLNELRFSRD